mmetsp:Transcript_59874/g.98828  ORF Transcript_59874/g.98828 Transcript_59874/m.98828 type:complete len:471 (+) Transcript_59874:91-1503(+)|eukprot:CAMPEP_0202721364 /NCGR_PEP_ID=MMETSP1385-20130828/148291_1 /ASSEMBLY_ACC=CAM_ASM_000861 /TAXON_ID=933848 /ORGANISM="Elphidium margaritaceum" /LENGTH=470 /DNA_ID=CAMNT_0049385567 /DNA_START=26 /DNA_END=1438 /DNA_ORIENTATION=-
MPPRGGAAETSSKSDAAAIQQNLRKQGIASTLEKKKNGNFIIRYILSFAQLVNAGKIEKSIVSDPQVKDPQDIKMDDTIAARIVDTDLKLAMQQVPTVKFSYIDNEVAPEIGIEKFEDYKVNDIDTMDDFFGLAQPDSMRPDAGVGDADLKEQFDGSGHVEKVWFQQTRDLKHNIEVQFTDCEDEYELIAINLLYNSKHVTKFIQHAGFKDAILMFHGARQEDMGSIFQTGFRLCPNKSIGSFYGKGHYFTPQALHAIRYLKLCKGYNAQKQFTLIAAFVNPGKKRTIRGFEARNQPISDAYDSHYVNVTDGMNSDLGLPFHLQSDYAGDVMEEYAIKDKTRILPRFYITLRKCERIFIWRDKNIANQFNGALLKDLKERTTIYGVTETHVAINLIKKKMKKNKVFVITNGAHDGDVFVDQVRNTCKLDTDILVFCNAVDWHSKWAKLFANVDVKCGKKHILEFIANCKH